MNAAIRAFLDIKVPMRDGVLLSTHVYLPPGDGPFPVMLVRTPYDAGKAPDFEWPARGFAAVRQDVRGKFRSAGEWYPWMSEKRDGEDTLDWILAQPWCDGNIVMYGGSYVSATQLAAATTGHKALVAFTPCLIGSDCRRAVYHGGAFRLAWQTRWTLAPRIVPDQDVIRSFLPLREMDVFCNGAENPYWRDFLDNPHDGPYWSDSSVQAHLGSVRAPAFIRTGWFDHFVNDVFDLFNGLKREAGSDEARRLTRILVGPWPHDVNQTKLDEVDFGEAGKAPDLFEQEVSFMRHFAGLKSDYDTGAPALRLFIMGPNVWRDEKEWPLARTVWTNLYLAGDGQANSASGDGKLASQPGGQPDSYVYDPANPVPTNGGAWDFSAVGPKDQTAIETRDDVLVYTSDVLAEDTEVTGPVTVRLFAASSAPDTDFTVKLVDVCGDGRAMSVTDGIVRARYRRDDGTVAFLTPGEPTEFLITCNPTAWVFPAGHRIRLEISSSNFPAFARNLNSRGDVATETELRQARQTVFHSAEYPSSLILPLIPVS